MINFKCPHCGNPIKVPDEAAGRKGTCNACGKLMQVPNSSVAPPEKAVDQKPDELTAMPRKAGNKKSPIKAFIAIFVCLFMLMNTPFSPIPFILVSLFCIFFLVLTGVVETPKRTLKRKMQEQNDEDLQIS